MFHVTAVIYERTKTRLVVWLLGNEIFSVPVDWVQGPDVQKMHAYFLSVFVFSSVATAQITVVLSLCRKHVKRNSFQTSFFSFLF